MNHVLIAASLLVGLLTVECVSAQVPVLDRKTTQVLRKSAELIEEQEWGQAVRALQSVLDQTEDSLVCMERGKVDGTLIYEIVSSRAEAERLLLSMPPAGLQFYELQYGPVATGRLRQAKESKDSEIMVDVVRRFRLTSSGKEATAKLATDFLEAVKPKEALPYFDRLIVWPGPAKMDTLTLYRATLTARAAANKVRAEEVWKQFATRIGNEKLQIGDRNLSVDELRKEWEQVVPAR